MSDSTAHDEALSIRRLCREVANSGPPFLRRTEFMRFELPRENASDLALDQWATASPGLGDHIGFTARRVAALLMIAQRPTVTSDLLRAIIVDSAQFPPVGREELQGPIIAAAFYTIGKIAGSLSSSDPLRASAQNLTNAYAKWDKSMHGKISYEAAIWAREQLAKKPKSECSQPSQPAARRRRATKNA